jgi:hypothetical protein
LNNYHKVFFKDPHDMRERELPLKGQFVIEGLYNKKGWRGRLAIKG